MYNRAIDRRSIWIVLFAGMLLAGSFLLATMYNSAFAQDSSPIKYAERGMGAVATFTATDPEDKDVYWNLSGTDAGDFEIDGGVLSFAEVPNYEAPADANTDNTYVVTVEACDVSPCDSAAVERKSTREVMVEVTNVEEPGEVMITVAGTGTTTGALPVLQPQVGVELTADLSDADTKDANNDDVTITPTWQWYRGSVSDSNKISGATEDMYTPVAEDVGNRLIAKATYKDGEDANNDKEAEEPTLRAVRAAPGSNSAPTFPDQDPGTTGDQKEQEREVAENTPAGMNIGDRVAANDAGDILAYSLNEAGAALFDIDIATGQLKTKGKLNREATGGDEHEVTVTAMDPFGITDAAMVTITVKNEDESPVIGASAMAMIVHKEPVPVDGTTPDPVALATYTATDDEDDAATTDLTWDLKGADEGKFTIGNDSGDRGELKFMANPDFEKPGDANEDNVYELIVVVEDSDDNTAELAVRVEVSNVNEAGEVTFSVNTPRVAVPVTATLSDPDGGETGHEWQWMVADNANAADDDKTDIEGATSATFTPRDADMGKNLSVKVEYTDGKGEDEAEDELATAVANSAAPRFYDSDTVATRKAITEFEIELAENTVTDIVLKMGQIHVVHRTDNVQSVLRYAVGGPDAAAFEIDTTNQVDLKATGQLDLEDKASYSVTVTATDSDSNSATLSVTIKVTEVDEAPEIMVGGLAISGQRSQEVVEGETAVATYTAAGPDADMAAWSLTGDDAGAFDIPGGELTFASTPDFEAPGSADGDNTYMVTIMADDGTYMDEHNVTVTVTNKEEMGTATLSTDMLIVGEAVTASVTDPDTVTAGTEMWQWARADDAGFTMNVEDIQDATMASYTPVEADDGKYLRATATYTDGYGADAAEVTGADAVTSNRPPAFATATTSRDVAENTAADEAVGEPVVATDPDMDVVTYALSGADATDFSIHNTGQITVGQGTMLDFETTMFYTVTVTATDPSGEMATIEVTINVTNVGLDTPYDADDSGVIEKGEVITSINDYLDGGTDAPTKAEVIRLIDLYLGA